MFKKKSMIEVVPESEYTFGEKAKDAALASGTVGATSFATYVWMMPEGEVVTPVEPVQIAPTLEPYNVLVDTPSIPVSSDLIQTGIIADSSLNMLANILDPVIQILMAISFPIASVIMLGACFLFMVGNSEKAWSTIFNAGLGYVLIQMSPLFLNILREVGKAV